jgi:soluble lytic murein transglycosylase-like protein
MSHALSPKNVWGLMLLIPATAEHLGVRNVRDPEQDLHGGMAYERWLMKPFDGDVRLVLAACNAGGPAVERHGGISPYAETRGDVEGILSRFGN